MVTREVKEEYCSRRLSCRVITFAQFVLQHVFPRFSQDGMLEKWMT